MRLSQRIDVLDLRLEAGRSDVADYEREMQRRADYHAENLERIRNEHDAAISKCNSEFKEVQSDHTAAMQLVHGMQDALDAERADARLMRDYMTALGMPFLSKQEMRELCSQMLALQETPAVVKLEPLESESPPLSPSVPAVSPTSPPFPRVQHYHMHGASAEEHEAYSSGHE